jgi:carbon storage regulator CsrA
MLILTRKLFEAVILEIGGVRARVTVARIDSRGQVALGFEAPDSVVILREELDDRRPPDPAREGQ